MKNNFGGRGIFDGKVCWMTKMNNIFCGKCVFCRFFIDNLKKRW